MKLNDKMTKRIHLIYGIVLSAMLTAVGILFICSCYSIYKSGSSPFTRESIGEAFSRIAVPAYLTLSALIIGGVIGILLPIDAPRLKGRRTPRVLVADLLKKVDTAVLDTESRAKIDNERKGRRLFNLIRSAILLVCAVVPLFLLLDPARFPAESGKYNSEILHGMLLYAAFLLPAAILETVWMIYSDRSYMREYAVLREALKSDRASTSDKEGDSCVISRAKEYLEKNKAPILLGVRIAFVASAVVFIILGITNDGMADVLNKAINICTECIGLG